MYKVIVWRKRLIQVELDGMEDIDLIARTFRKLMVWSDEPMFELKDGMVFGFMAYTTKQNLIHMFNLVGIRQNAYSEPEPVMGDNFHANFRKRLYIDRKFVKKKMSRKNYLDQFIDHTRDDFEHNFKKHIKKNPRWVKEYHKESDILKIK